MELQLDQQQIQDIYPSLREVASTTFGLNVDAGTIADAGEGIVGVA